LVIINFLWCDPYLTSGDDPYLISDDNDPCLVFCDLYLSSAKYIQLVSGGAPYLTSVDDPYLTFDDDPHRTPGDDRYLTSGNDLIHT
jgi:hypothetical protein